MPDKAKREKQGIRNVHFDVEEQDAFLLFWFCSATRRKRKNKGEKIQCLAPSVVFFHSGFCYYDTRVCVRVCVYVCVCMCLSLLCFFLL
jgi:hypothetical protein